MKKPLIISDKNFKSESIKKQIQFGEIRLNSLIVRSPTVFYTQRINNKEFIKNKAKITYVTGKSCPSSSGYIFGERNVIEKNNIKPTNK